MLAVGVHGLYGVAGAEVRGEGIFLRFPENTVDAWLDKVSGSDQIESMREAHGL